MERALWKSLAGFHIAISIFRRGKGVLRKDFGPTLYFHNPYAQWHIKCNSHPQQLSVALCLPTMLVMVFIELGCLSLTVKTMGKWSVVHGEWRVWVNRDLASVSFKDYLFAYFKTFNTRRSTQSLKWRTCDSESMSSVLSLHSQGTQQLWQKRISPGFVTWDFHENMSWGVLPGQNESTFILRNKWKVPSPTMALFHKSLGEAGGWDKV